MSLAATASRWLQRGKEAVVVEVVDHRGSVPRETGTMMLVGDAEVRGTIGGGHLEWVAIETARALLQGRAVDAVQHYPLGPKLGQCCGGSVSLAYRTLAQRPPAGWPREAARFTLQLYGAGHVGRAIVKLLEGVHCDVQWIDEREDQFPAEPDAPHIQRVNVDGVEGEVAVASPGTFYLVLTHNHDLDMRITEAILRRGDFGYLGLIGSKTKRQRFIHRFEERGIPEQAVGRMVCPIGIPGIEGKEPEVIAIAVVAQLLQASPPEANSI